MSVKITDLVDQEAIDRLHELDSELAKVLETYKKVAQDLAKGLNINVSCIGDIDKLEQILAVKGKEAAQVQQQLTSVIGEQQKVIANTTNTISRQLMEQEKVNKTQRDAYTEYERVKNLLAQVNGTYENNVKSLLRVNEAIAANKKQQEDLKKQFENGRISTEQYNEALLQLTIKERELKQEKSSLTTLLKNEERENQAVIGSYNQMSQQLELLKKAYKSMTQEEKQSALGKEMESAIQNLDAHLKDLAADMGEFQRNVGNYAVAGGSIKKDLKELVLEIANLTMQYRSLSTAEKNSAEGQELSEHIQNLTERAGVLRDAIQDTNDAINNSASDTRGFDQISEGIQLCIDGFGLATGAAEMLGLSESDLAEVQTKLQAAIAASNAMSKIQVALQKQSALMQGITNIQMKAGAIAVKLKTAAEGKSVVTTKLLTAAQWLFNKACSANPIGFLVVAIMACIAAVTALIKVFSLFGSDSEKRKKIYEEEKKAYEELTKNNDKYIERIKARGATEWEVAEQSINAKNEELGQAIKMYEAAKAAYDDDEEEYKDALDAKKKAFDDYNNSIDNGYNKVLEFITEYRDKDREAEIGTLEFKKEVAQKNFSNQYSILIDYYSREQAAIRQQLQFYEKMYAILGNANGANVKAMIDKLNAQLDASTKNLDADITGLINARNKSINEAEKEQNKKNAEAAKKAAEAEEKRQKAILDEMKKARQKRIELIEDYEEQKIAIENEKYNNEIAELKKRLEKLGEDEVQMRQAIQDQIVYLTSIHERNLSVIQYEAEMQRLKIKKEMITLRLDAVEKGSKEEYDIQQELLKNAEQNEIASIKKRVEQSELTEEEGEAFILAIKQKYIKKKEDLEEDYANTSVKRTMDEYAEKQGAIDSAYVSDLNSLKNKYVEEMRLAKGNAAKQEQIRAKFEADQAKLSDDYAVQTARNSVAMLEEVLKTENLSAEERKKYQEELAKAKGALETAMADQAKAQIDSVIEKDNEARNKRIANAQQWLQVTSDSLNAINDLVGTIYDAKIEKVEAEQEANQEAADAEQERISELVQKKVITEEEGEARKRAAEAKTAKKNEELEKKKAKIKQQQAIWDKANSAAQCAIATALGIMQLWVNPGFPAAIPMAAVVGALGALQLATILATPLPKYAKGTTSHKGGPAVVGDGGEPELVTFGGKSWITPDTPTIVDLPAGAAVIPHISGVDESLVSIPTSSNDSKTPVIINNDYSRLEAKMDNFIYLIKQQTKQQRQIASNAALQRISDRL